MAKENWIGEGDESSRGQPGTQFVTRWAGVRKAKNGQFELVVKWAWGSNQGYLEEHGRDERRFRADDLDGLLRIGISELKGETEGFEDARFAQAVRSAIYQAQDAD